MHDAKNIWSGAAALVALAAVLTACGGGGGSSAATATTSVPTSAATATATPVPSPCASGAAAGGAAAGSGAAAAGCAGAGAAAAGAAGAAVAAKAASCPTAFPKGIPTLVSPAAGATGVPVTVGTVLMIQYDAYPASAIGLSGPAGSVATMPTAVPSPLPSGAPASPLYALAVPVLQAATTYTVTYTLPTSGASPCPASQTFAVGSFTTQ